MPVIRIGGKAKAKPATTSKTSTSSKRSSTKRGTASPAKKRSTTAKRTTAKKTGGRGTGTPRGPRTPKINPTVLAKHEKALKAAGKDRRDAEAAHDKAVNNVHKVVEAAIKAEVPMSIISTSVGVSRQWLYKMGTFRDRQNGNGPAKATSAARRGTKKSSASKSRPRVRSKR